MECLISSSNDLLGDLLSYVRLDDQPTERPSKFYRSGPLGDLKVSGSYFIPVMMSHADPEFLTYRVDTPISVKRGQSAMVPIFKL